LGKGGVDSQRGETEKVRLPPGLQRRKTQSIPSCQGDHTRASRGLDHSRFFQASPPGKKNVESEKITSNGETQHEPGIVYAHRIRTTTNRPGKHLRTRPHTPGSQEFFLQDSRDQRHATNPLLTRKAYVFHTISVRGRHNLITRVSGQPRLGRYHDAATRKNSLPNKIRQGPGTTTDATRRIRTGGNPWRHGRPAATRRLPTIPGTTILTEHTAGPSTTHTA
jgi:hypothetical protein